MGLVRFGQVSVVKLVIYTPPSTPIHFRVNFIRKLIKIPLSILCFFLNILEDKLKGKVFSQNFDVHLIIYFCSGKSDGFE